MKLFVIEGLDGSGKSTQLSLLREFFMRMGHDSEYLHFPRTEAPYFGELIARFLRGEFGSLAQVDPYLVAMLYAGDRMDASGEIKAWLAGGKTVFLDRYTYSNIAYQCAKLDDESDREKLMNWILSLEFGHFAIPRPGLNVFLDVPAAFTGQNLSSDRPGHARKYLNGSNDIHESSLLFQKKVRDIYIRIAERDETMTVLNCTGSDGEMLPPGIISKRIIKLITDRKLI